MTDEELISVRAGEAIRATRLARGWTVEESAEHASVAPKTWVRAERGAVIRARSWRRIATALGLPEGLLLESLQRPDGPALIAQKLGVGASVDTERSGRSVEDHAPITDAIVIMRALVEVGAGSMDAIDTVLRAADAGLRNGAVSTSSAIAIVAAINALSTLARGPSTPAIQRARMALIGVLEAELLPNSGLRLEAELDGLLVRVLSLCDADRRRLLEMLSMDVFTKRLDQPAHFDR